MYCKNDFRRFVGEILCVKHNRISLRDINRVIENLTNQNIVQQSDYIGQDIEQDNSMESGEGDTDHQQEVEVDHIDLGKEDEEEYGVEE